MITSFQQLSQFWYDENTIDKLVDIILKTTDSQSKIALISCPTLYSKLKQKSSNENESMQSTNHKVLYEINIFFSYTVRI